MHSVRASPSLNSATRDDSVCRNPTDAPGVQ